MSERKEVGIIILIVILGFLLFIVNVNAADPAGPDDIAVVNNTTKQIVPEYKLNISGGYIATLDLNITSQNTRWKAFVGNVTGKFTLDDASGNTIYDWSLALTSGQIYAIRNESGNVSWSNINCSNITHLENENIRMVHSNPNDNITATFNVKTHGAFSVAGNSILANSCWTLHPYVSSSAQSSNWVFNETALYDSTNQNIIYAQRFENDAVGYNSETFDFQMLVPENGNSTWTGKTAYYLYLELT